MTDDLPSLNDIDGMLYYTLVKARKEAYAKVKDKSKPISQRLSNLLDFAQDLQSQLDDYPDENDESIDFFEVFENPELINPEWEIKVENGEVKPISNVQANENITMYFLYKYFLQAVYDRDVLSKAKMAVVGVLVNTYFGEDSWTIHLWSKETEHSQYNMDRYKKLLKTAKCLSVEELKKRLIK